MQMVDEVHTIIGADAASMALCMSTPVPNPLCYLYIVIPLRR
jgi:hypothetical protein